MPANSVRVQKAGGVVVHFNAVGLVAMAIATVVAAALLSHAIQARRGPAPAAPGRAPQPAPPATLPPWGELLISDIDLEPPEEYLSFQVSGEPKPAWTFSSRDPEAIRALLADSGLTPEQIVSALEPASMERSASGTILHPSDELVLSLAPEARARLYAVLGRDEANMYMHSPFTFPGDSFEKYFGTGDTDDEAVAMVRRLLYPRGAARLFSDFDTVLAHLPDEASRLKLVSALSRQKAVLARLHVSHGTDIERLVAYWGQAPGVHVKDMRPLLESLERLPEGGTISVLYLLPPFARERLYTFPMPSRRGEPGMDCFWTAMNFANVVPDDRFANPAETNRELATSYYQIGAPTSYGDLIVLLDQSNVAVHAAVHVADDLVFTKNGDNYEQPWMLMHLKDMVGAYPTDVPLRMVYFRSKVR